MPDSPDQPDFQDREESHSADSHEHGHIPVLLDRCVELLAPALTRRHADGTRTLFWWTPPSVRAATPNAF